MTRIKEIRDRLENDYTGEVASDIKYLLGIIQYLIIEQKEFDILDLASDYFNKKYAEEE